jgi:hypothetical protein
MQTLLKWKSNNYYILWVWVCLCWVLLIHHAMRMRHIVFRGLPRSTVSHTRHEFLEKIIADTKFVFWFPPQRLSETVLILKKLIKMWSKMCTGLHVQYPLFLPDFNETFPVTLKKKYSNIIFHENLSSWIRAVLCEQMDGPTDITKLIVILRNFANAPNNELLFIYMRNFLVKLALEISPGG